jgi:hypothetical protein
MSDYCSVSLSCSKDGDTDTEGMETRHRALTVAFWNHHESIVRMLLDAGATVEFSPMAKLEIGRAQFSTLLRVGVTR